MSTNQTQEHNKPPLTRPELHRLRAIANPADIHAELSSSWLAHIADTIARDLSEAPERKTSTESAISALDRLTQHYDIRRDPGHHLTRAQQNHAWATALSSATVVNPAYRSDEIIDIIQAMQAWPAHQYQHHLNYLNTHARHAQRFLVLNQPEQSYPAIDQLDPNRVLRLDRRPTTRELEFHHPIGQLTPLQDWHAGAATAKASQDTFLRHNPAGNQPASQQNTDDTRQAMMTYRVTRNHDQRRDRLPQENILLLSDNQEFIQAILEGQLLPPQTPVQDSPADPSRVEGIKIITDPHTRLLTPDARVRCHSYTFLTRHPDTGEYSDRFLTLVAFAENVSKEPLQQRTAQQDTSPKQHSSE